MPKSIQTTALTCVLGLLPVIGIGQTCKTASIPASTPTRQFINNNNGTVTDTKTGLMWKRCSEGQTWNSVTCSGSAADFTWKAALQRAQTHNRIGFAGFKDWRLPNVKELFSIVEKQCYAPAINLTIFPSKGYYALFWSSSPSATTAGDDAWGVYFDSGYATWLSYKNNGVQVRLVRS
jgi:Protein of unknown function (DUF1566)